MPRCFLAGLALAMLLAVNNRSLAQAPAYAPQPAPHYVPVPYPVYVYVPVVQPPPLYHTLGPLRYDRHPLDLSPVPHPLVTAMPAAAPSAPVVHQTGYRGPKQEQPRVFSKNIGSFIFK
jgi:hypothetical protein